MRLRRPKAFIAFFSGLLPFALIAAAGDNSSDRAANKSTDSAASRRVVEVSFIEHLGAKKLRLHLSAFEVQNGVRFPITTLERESFSVEFPNTASPPAHADSLSIYGGSIGDFKRATILAFNLDNSLTPATATELKTQVSELIPKLPSTYLAAFAIAGGSSRLIGEVTPEKSENVNKLQRDLLVLERDGHGAAISDILCFAAEQFRSWGLRDFRQGDQKALIIVSPSGDARTRDRSNAQNCFAILQDQGVRVFQVEYGGDPGKNELSALAPLTHGFVQRVNQAQDSFPALNNIVNNLRNEYVLDITAPDIALEDQPLEFDVKISYHDDVFRTGAKSVGFIIPTLAQVFQQPATNEGVVVETNTAKPQYPAIYALIASIVMLFLMTVITIRTAIVRQKTVTCNTCGMRVLKDYSNCSFRQQDCVGRLVFVGGPLSGRMLPLRVGDNKIGPYAAIKIPGPGVGLLPRGIITISATRAIYKPLRKRKNELINGWPVSEPRLLAIGSILRIGRHHLRFEMNPNFYRANSADHREAS